MIVSRLFSIAVNKDRNHENTSMHSCYKNIGWDLLKIVSVEKETLCWVAESTQRLIQSTHKRTHFEFKKLIHVQRKLWSDNLITIFITHNLFTDNLSPMMYS